MTTKHALHAVVASNGACRRRPVILPPVVRTPRDSNRPVKIVQEFDLARNAKTRRV
ncbi:MAG: hypothetical protein OSB69_24055 [Alphaproteobacteria bacterium]|nr:hypothetical protein [Alphaproteobacteria bacterium]